MVWVATFITAFQCIGWMIGVSLQRAHQLVAEGRLRALKVETSGKRSQLVLRRTEIERFKQREPKPWR